jgi:hypothetical protein
MVATKVTNACLNARKNEPRSGEKPKNRISYHYKKKRKAEPPLHSWGEGKCRLLKEEHGSTLLTATSAVRLKKKYFLLKNGIVGHIGPRRPGKQSRLLLCIL